MYFPKFVTQIISNLPPELGLEKAKVSGRTPFICIQCIEQFFCQNVFMEWNNAVTRDRVTNLIMYKPNYLLKRRVWNVTFSCQFPWKNIEELNSKYSLRGREVSDYWTKNGHFNVWYDSWEYVLIYHMSKFPSSCST